MFPSFVLLVGKSEVDFQEEKKRGDGLKNLQYKVLTQFSKYPEDRMTVLSSLFS